MNEGELGRIINLIMENPTLLGEIKRLAMDNKGEEAVSSEDTEVDVVASENAREIEPTPQARVSNTKRRELINALAPYISENRRKAIESFMTIADILDLMRGK